MDFSETIIFTKHMIIEGKKEYLAAWQISEWTLRSVLHDFYETLSLKQFFSLSLECSKTHARTLTVYDETGKIHPDTTWSLYMFTSICILSDTPACWQKTLAVGKFLETT